MRRCASLAGISRCPSPENSHVIGSGQFSWLAHTLTITGLTLSAIGCPGTATTPAVPSAAAAGSNEDFGYIMYDELLHTYVDGGFVDYAGLKSSRLPLDQFVASMGRLSREQVAAWPQAQQLAFWINAYNAITLQYVLNHYPIQKGGFISGALYPANSIRQIPGVWDSLTTRVAGADVTLNDIEHAILRKKFAEPRIHLAIVCASISCPPLRSEAFVAERLEEQLADQSRTFLAHPDRFRIDRDRNVVYLSPIFDWFGKDFVPKYSPASAFGSHGESVTAALNFAADYISADGAEYIRTQRYSVKFAEYDWSLNEQ